MKFNIEIFISNVFDKKGCLLAKIKTINLCLSYSSHCNIGMFLMQVVRNK